MKFVYKHLLSALILIVFACQAIAADIPLLQSIKQDDVEQFKTLTVDESLLELSVDNQPLLHVAAKYKAQEIFTWLLSQQVDINQLDNSGSPPISVALKAHHFDFAQWLLSKGALLNSPSTNQQLVAMGIEYTPLFSLISNQASVESIDWAINQGASLSSQSGNQNLYAMAFASNHTGLLERFYSLKPIPFRQTYVGGSIDGFPITFLMCPLKNKQIIQQAINNGLPKDLAINGMTLLSICIQPENQIVVQILLDNQYKISRSDVNRAAQSDPAIYALLKSTIDSRKQFVIDFFKAIQRGDITKVEELLNQGVNPNYDAFSYNFERADRVNNIDLEDNVTDFNSSAHTPLLFAIKSNSIDIANLLITNGADVNLISSSDTSPLSYATYNNQKQFVQLLMQHGAEPSQYVLLEMIKKNWWELATPSLSKQTNWQQLVQNEYTIDKTLLKAIESNQVEFIEAALTSGLNILDDRHITYAEAISAALNSQSVEMLKLLLKDVPSNSRRLDGLPFIFELASSEMLEELVAQGLTISGGSKPALVQLASMGKIDSLKVLLSRDIALGSPAYEGSAALLASLEEKQFETALFIFKQNLSFWEAKNPYSEDIFLKVVENNDLEMFKQFLSSTAHQGVAQNDSNFIYHVLQKPNLDWLQVLLESPSMATFLNDKQEFFDSYFRYSDDPRFVQLPKVEKWSGSDANDYMKALMKNLDLTSQSLAQLIQHDENVIQILQGMCNQAEHYQVKDNCNLFNTEYSETSINFLVKAIEQQQTDDIQKWFELVPSPYVELDSNEATNKGLLETIIKFDNEFSFSKFYEAQDNLGYEWRGWIAQYDAVSIFNKLKETGALTNNTAKEIVETALSFNSPRLSEFARNYEIDYKHVLTKVVELGNEASLKNLLITKPELLQQPDTGSRAMLLAIREHLPTMLNALLEAGYSVNHSSESVVAPIRHIISCYIQATASLSHCHQLLEVTLPYQPNFAIPYDNQPNIIAYLLSKRLIPVLKFIEAKNVNPTVPWSDSLKPYFMEAIEQRDTNWITAFITYTDNINKDVIFWAQQYTKLLNDEDTFTLLPKLTEKSAPKNTPPLQQKKQFTATLTPIDKGMINVRSIGEQRFIVLTAKNLMVTDKHYVPLLQSKQLSGDYDNLSPHLWISEKDNLALTTYKSTLFAWNWQTGNLQWQATINGDIHKGKIDKVTGHLWLLTGSFAFIENIVKINLKDHNDTLEQSLSSVAAEYASSGAFTFTENGKNLLIQYDDENYSPRVKSVDTSTLVAKHDWPIDADHVQALMFDATSNKTIAITESHSEMGRKTIFKLYEGLDGQHAKDIEIADFEYVDLQYFTYPKIIYQGSRTEGHQQGVRLVLHNLENDNTISYTNPNRRYFNFADYSPSLERVTTANETTRVELNILENTATSQAQQEVDAQLIVPKGYTKIHQLSENYKEDLVIASASTESNARQSQSWLWDGKQQRAIRPIGQGEVKAVSNRYDIAILQVDDDSFALINTLDGTLRSTFSSRSNFEPVITPNGKELWYVPHANSLLKYNLYANKHIEEISLGLSGIDFTDPAYNSGGIRKHCSVIDPTSNTLVVCQQNSKHLKIVDLITLKHINSEELQDKAKWVNSDSNGNYVVLDENNVFYHINSNGKILTQHKIDMPEIDYMSFNKTSGLMAFSHREHGIQVYNLSGEPIKQFIDESLFKGVTIDQVVFNQKGNTLYAAGINSPEIIKFSLDILTSRELDRPERFAPSSQPIESFKINNQSLLLTVGSQTFNDDISQNYLAMWDLNSGQETLRQAITKWHELDNNGGLISQYADDNNRLFSYQIPTSGITHISKPLESFDNSFADESGTFNLASFGEKSIFSTVEPTSQKILSLVKHKESFYWVSYIKSDGTISSIKKLEQFPAISLQLLTGGLEVASYHNGKLAFVNNNRLHLFDVEQDKKRWVKDIPAHLYIQTLISQKQQLFADNGQSIYLTLENRQSDLGQLLIRYESTSGESQIVYENQSQYNSIYDNNEFWTFLHNQQRALIAKLDSNGDISIYTAKDKSLVHVLKGHYRRPEHVLLSGDAKHLLTSGENNTFLWKLATKTINTPTRIPSSTPIKQVQFTLSHVWGLDTDGKLKVFGHSGEFVGEVTSFNNRGWMVTTPNGIYDSDTPGNIKGASWVLSDEPLKTYPVELFLKQKYEPRLLARILGNESFEQNENLAEVNRIQPNVTIESIKGNDDGTVNVEVLLTRGSGETNIHNNADIYDLRLFRDEKQVNAFPIDHGKIEMGSSSSKIVTFDNIYLPSTDATQQITFSAMAFNDDGVKSLTASKTYSNSHLSKRDKRAFIINIGVDEYSNPAWKLSYAVNDAKLLGDRLTSSIEQTKVFTNVIHIPLYGDKDKALTNQAVKSTLQSLLNGTPQYSPVTPDDSIIITWAGHGFADDSGLFHLFTSEVGNGTTKTVDSSVLLNTITTKDLSRLLEPLDAENILLIVDACNSAASIQSDGFKPGPMGNKGFGQLAWFKGMQILTATQADDVALESNQLKHGLLSYALGKEGLELSAADFLPKDSTLFSSEWLDYGQLRVPELYLAMNKGKLEEEINRSRGIKVKLVEPKTIKPQLPGLFDFSKKVQSLKLKQLTINTQSE